MTQAPGFHEQAAPYTVRSGALLQSSTSATGDGLQSEAELNQLLDRLQAGAAHERRAMTELLGRLAAHP